jgi:hypothetical protein
MGVVAMGRVSSAILEQLGVAAPAGAGAKGEGQCGN